MPAFPAKISICSTNTCQPRSLELLRSVNVLDDIRAELVPIREMRDYKIPGGTEVVRSFPTSAAGPPPSPDIPYASTSRIFRPMHS
jgi:hypothetical protein